MLCWTAEAVFLRNVLQSLLLDVELFEIFKVTTIILWIFLSDVFSFQLEMEEDIDMVSKVYFGWVNSVLENAKNGRLIKRFDQFEDGAVLLDLVRKLDETYNLCKVKGLPDAVEIVKNFFGSRNIENTFDDETTEIMLMDILWAFMLNFTICPGDEIKPDDKCIELGRCFLMEWLQILCPEARDFDGDEELTMYFKGNRLIIDVIESVFSTTLTLPSGSLHKEIFCSLMLVEEAFGISKEILDSKMLIDGECPEFALIVYLSLLKTKYLDDTKQGSFGSNIVQEIITEQPSKENFELDSSEIHTETIAGKELSGGSHHERTSEQQFGFPISGSITSLITPSESGFYSCNGSHENEAGDKLEAINGFSCSTPRELTESNLNSSEKTWQDFLEGNFEQNETSGGSSSKLDDCLKNESNQTSKQELSIDIPSSVHDEVRSAQDTLLTVVACEDTQNSCSGEITIIDQKDTVVEIEDSSNPSEESKNTGMPIASEENVSTDTPLNPHSPVTDSCISQTSSQVSAKYTLRQTPVSHGRQSPSSDPLMNLLDSIASKGNTLKQALDNSLLNESIHTEKKYLDFDEKVKLMERITELETKNLELSLTIETLSGDLSDNERKLSSESLNFDKALKEANRLLDVNRSFREENLKMEETIIHLEDVIQQKTAEASQLRNQLKFKSDECDSLRLRNENIPTIVDVEEKDSIILSIQHDLENVMFEKCKIAQELEHTREVIHQRDESAKKLFTTEQRKTQKSNQADTEQKLEELSRTIGNLEKSLLESNQRNAKLNEKLDMINHPSHLSYSFMTPNMGLYPLQSDLTASNLNRSYPGFDCINHSKHHVTSLSCADNYNQVTGFAPHDSRKVELFDQYPSYRSQRKSDYQFFERPSCETVHANNEKPWQTDFSPHPTSSNLSFDNQNRAPLSGSLRDENLCACQIANTCRNGQQSACCPKEGLSVELNSGKRNLNQRHFSSEHTASEKSKAETAVKANSETQEVTTDVVSANTRKLIDSILAKYSTNRPDEIASTQSITEHGVSSPGLDNTLKTEYNSIREATMKLRDELTDPKRNFNVETRSVFRNEASDSVKIRSFDEFVSSPISKSNASKPLIDSSDDLKPFLSRTLASAGVFLHDGNTDLQNKSLLSSVRNCDNALNNATTSSTKGKFGALFKSYDDQANSEHRMSSTEDITATQDVSSRVAEIGQRLRNGIFTSSTDSNHGTSEQNVSESNKMEPCHSDGNPSSHKFMKRNDVRQIGDEILTRYKTELRLTDDSNGGTSNSFVRSLDDSFFNNWTSIRYQGEVYKSKIQPPKVLLEPSKRPEISSAEQENGLVTASTSAFGTPEQVENDEVKGYLNQLDNKYPKSFQSPLSQSERTLKSSNGLRSSTPTLLVTRKKEDMAPSFDVSHISMASNFVHGDKTRSVQFYNESSILPRSDGDTRSRKPNSGLEPLNGKFIHPTVLFAK